MAASKKGALHEEPKQDVLEEKLGAIEKTVTQIDVIRKRQFLITLCGILLILLVMAAFVTSLTDFARNYNATMLMDELSNNSDIITKSPELHQLGKDFQEIFVPAYKEELIAALEAEMPKLRKEVFKSADELQNFLLNDIKSKLLERMTKVLEKIEKKIIEKHADLSPEMLDKAFQEVNAHFIEQITDILEKRLKVAKEKLSLLDQSFNKYKDTPEYATVKTLPAGEVENKLIETFLELWIYHLNPAKGAVTMKGGVK
ncbi:MAG: hypothetical protein WC071_07605 [Victivallaceae bacterium]